MDPTKPILDIYSDSYHQDYSKKNIRNYQKPTRDINHRDIIQHNNYRKAQQLSYNQLKEKYQDLYQSYNEKVQKLNRSEAELQQYRHQNQRTRQQLEKSSIKNQQLNAALIKKNMQLEEAYRRLQDQLKKPNGKRRVNESSIDRLEDGLREAINSNFQLLREASLAEVRSYLPSRSQM